MTGKYLDAEGEGPGEGDDHQEGAEPSQQDGAGAGAGRVRCIHHSEVQSADPASPLNDLNVCLNWITVERRLGR